MATAPRALAAEVARRRTFAIISHPDAGKTTLTERLLLLGGAIHIAGAVKARKATRYALSDWMEIERQRGISVTTSVMQFEYRGYAINLLDTPGHEDFSEDTYRVLSAVDFSLMVIDAAKGIETRTLKLLDVCRAHDLPILTFVNKFDRESREPLSLLDEIERVLGTTVIPVTWPVGMARTFTAVCKVGETAAWPLRAAEDGDLVVDASPARARQELQLLSEALRALDRDAVLAGRQTPVFFGSALKGIGVQELLDGLIDIGSAPQPRRALERWVAPEEDGFAGSVFKVQANIDPAHRDRIAFVRICSGSFERGMTLRNCRSGKELRANSAVAFLSRRRDHIEHAYAGDIIGIPSHGAIRLNDTLTAGEVLRFAPLPVFAPEVFRRVELVDPQRGKQLRVGLAQLSEEGAIQVLVPHSGRGFLLGAAGPLQFEVVSDRLLREYHVPISLTPAPYSSAWWASAELEHELADFMAANASRVAFDPADRPLYLATSTFDVEAIAARWPRIRLEPRRR
jgi:peptide chain release factor 3